MIFDLLCPRGFFVNWWVNINPEFPDLGPWVRHIVRFSCPRHNEFALTRICYQSGPTLLEICGVEVWRGGLGGAYLLSTLSSAVDHHLFTAHPVCVRFVQDAKLNVDALFSKRAF